MGTAAAQHSILFSMDSNHLTLDNGGGYPEIGLLREDEIGLVTPKSGGTASATVFLSTGAQWAFLGDADGDGRIADHPNGSPGGDVNAIFVRRFPEPPPAVIGPRAVFLSKESDSDLEFGSGDGDVFRYVDQGQREFFLREAHLVAAIDQPPFSDVDLDAICQSDEGDLFVSFDFTELVAGGVAENGALIRIPRSAITYDAKGNVSAIASGTARVIATEADMHAMAVASGMTTAGGQPPSASFDLSALEIDPGGGTWSPPQMPGLTLPNMLFAFDGFSNEAAVLTTVAGGSIAEVNGTPLASPFGTTGLQMGILPGSSGVGGLMGLAVVDERPRVFALELYPTDFVPLTATSFSRMEISGATPTAPVVFFYDLGPSGVGAVVPTYTVPGIGGTLFGVGSMVVQGLEFAGSRGYTGRIEFLPAGLKGQGLNLVYQALDLLTLGLAVPAAMTVE